MKHNYKIKIDPPMPSDQQIDGHKDFGRILADYRNLTQPIYRKPLYKNPKAFIGLVFIVAIAMLVFWTVEKDDKAKALAESTKPLPEMPFSSFAAAPISALEVPVQLLASDFVKPQTQLLSNGIRLSFPEKPFESMAAAPFAELASVEVRTARNPAELIAMGIPSMIGEMAISGDVMEVRASGSEAPLQMAKGKAIGIDLFTTEGNLPLLYKLDVEKQTWTLVEGAKFEKVAQPVSQVKKDDGFGVVEFDANGKPRPKAQAPNADSAVSASVFRIQVLEFGTYALAKPLATTVNSNTEKLTFVDAEGKLMPLHTVYGLPNGAKTLQILHPKTAAYSFDVHFLKGIPTTFLAILPDGRTAFSEKINASGAENGIKAVKMQLSEDPLENLEDLMQRLAKN